MAWERYGYSYEKYMQQIIDACITQQVVDTTKKVANKGKNVESEPLINGRVQEDIMILSSSHTRASLRRNYNSSDCNIPTKKVGYLAMECTDFRFVGPDRLPVNIDSVDKCIHVANIIKNTNLLNYRMARIPLGSGLNVQAWERELQDYPDDKPLQYIKFGFPLSLVSADSLHNLEVSNHFSARQYPEDIKKYLSKETRLGGHVRSC